LCGHGGKLPKVVAENAPFDPQFAVLMAFASKGLPEIGVLEDADAPFGAAAALL